jgi:hypothetical protein
MKEIIFRAGKYDQTPTAPVIFVLDETRDNTDIFIGFFNELL